jgi:hypothetical protein
MGGAGGFACLFRGANEITKRTQDLDGKMQNDEK